MSSAKRNPPTVASGGGLENSLPKTSGIKHMTYTLSAAEAQYLFLIHHRRVPASIAHIIASLAFPEAAR